VHTSRIYNCVRKPFCACVVCVVCGFQWCKFLCWGAHKGFPEGPPTLDLTPAPRADAFIQPQTLPLLASMFCCACCLPSPFTPTHKGFPEGPPTSHSEQKPDITQRAEARHREFSDMGWHLEFWTFRLIVRRIVFLQAKKILFFHKNKISFFNSEISKKQNKGVLWRP
jgi:hypothetical protein